MKKVIISTVLGVAVFGLVAPSALATVVDDATTKGTIEFKLPTTNDDIILPDTEPPIVVKPPIGSETATGLDGLNFTVPALDFGVVETSMLDAKYHAMPQVFTGKVAPIKEYTLPAMVIVRDTSGKKGSWSMNVKAGKFMSGTDELVGATLSFVNPRVFNSQRAVPTQEIAKGEITGFDFSDGVIDVSSAAKSFVHSTTGAVDAQTTYMLDKKSESKYQVVNPGDPSQSVTNLDPKKGVEGAQLAVPGKSSKLLKVKYTADLVWTMNDTPDAVADK